MGSPINRGPKYYQIHSILSVYTVIIDLAYEFKMPKRKQYTVQEKLHLVDRVRKGESAAKVCRESGVAEGTLRGWLKEEVKLREYLHSVDTDDGLSRKRQRTGT